MSKQIIKASTQQENGLLVDGEVKQFGSDGTFIEHDDGKAKEIQEYYGRNGTGDVAVVDYDNSERGHKYFFGGFSSKKARANYKRIFGHD